MFYFNDVLIKKKDDSNEYYLVILVGNNEEKRISEYRDSFQEVLKDYESLRKINVEMV